VNERRIALGGIACGLLATLLTLPPLTLRPVVVPVALAGVALAVGVWLLSRGERHRGALSIAAGIGGGGLGLVIVNADRSIIVAVVTTGLFATMLQQATPLAFAGIGGLYAERSGVTNIGLDGMMLTGAFFGVLFDDVGGSWVVGLVGAAVAGAVLALLHAFFSIHLQADQIVTGTAINILAAGGTTFLFRSYYGVDGNPAVESIPDVTIPGLSSVPLIGPVVGTMNLMIWLVILLVVATWVFVFKTPWGLRLRAVGEHPRAADTIGIDVYRIRYLAVTASGALAALGGAYISFGILNGFNEGMTVGRGFVALAALIFGKWRPFGLVAATLLFGFSISLGYTLQSAVPHLSAFWLFVLAALPYAATLVAVVGLVGRSTPPAAVGKPYARR
jgi:simple sugar transport system permease protein